MNIVRRSIILNEVLLGQITAAWGKKLSTNIYKNPPTIRRLDPWVRAISDKYGNLYIVEEPVAIHVDILSFLADEGEIDKTFNYANYEIYFDDTDNKDGIVAWQRHGNTMDLFFGESYSGDDINNIPYRWIDKVIENNLTINFNEQQIFANEY